jgi:large subunit ribosomal protein L28
MRVTVGDVLLALLGQPVPAGPADQRDQLTAAAEHPLQDLRRDGGQVVTDHGEVALDHAEDVAGLAGTGHRDRLPRGNGDRAVARVPGGGGHLEDVGVEPAGRLVDRQGGEALDLRLGRDHRHPDVEVLLRGPGRDASGAHGVVVVGQDHDLGRARLGDRVQDHPGRGPVAGTALDHDRARVTEEPGQTGAGGHRDDAAAGARPGPARRRRDLLGEVRDPDPVGTTRGDAGLDRGTHVVDVDVDVPQPLSPDHDEGVAERRQGLAQRGHGVVVGIEEVHHLVRRATFVQVGHARRHRDRPRAERRGHRDRVATREHRLGRVEDDAQPATTRVDDAGHAELFELLRRVGEGLAGGLGRGGEHVARACALVRGTPYGGVGGGPGDRQDRALHGRPDRGVRRLGGLGHRLGHDRRVAFAAPGPAHPGDQGPQQLAEDHAAVAAGAQQRTTAERGESGAEVGVVTGLVDGVAGGAHRQVHVGAGVAVGHRVDVEGVDLLASRREGVDRDVDEAPDDRELDPAADRCFHRLPSAPQVGARVARAAARVVAGSVIRPRVGASDILSRLPAPRGPRSTSQPGVTPVAAVCDICAKKPGFGNNRPWSKKITKRRFDPNIQRVRATVNGTRKRLNVCTGCLKAGKVSR